MTTDPERHQDIAAAASESKTGIRRVADSEELQELEFMENKRRRQRRRGTVFLWLAVAVVVAGVLYAFIARHLAQRAHERYLEVRRDMDIEKFETFNAVGLARADAAFEESESINVYLGLPRLLGTVDSALHLLRRNFEQAQNNESDFEQLRETYRLRREEAVQAGIPELRPEAWANIQSLAASFEQGASQNGFAYQKAREDLRKAVFMLGEMRHQYAEMREYNGLLERCREIESDLHPPAWKTNLPDAYQQLEEAKKRAEDLANQRQWNDAIRSLSRYVDVYKENAHELEAARAEAEAKMREAVERVGSPDAGRVRQFAPKRFQDIWERHQTMKKAFERGEYERVEELAETIATDFAKLQAERTAREKSLNSLREEFTKLYGGVSKQEVVLRRNWPEQWRAIEGGVGRIRALSGNEDSQLELANLYAETIERLKTLIGQARQAAKQAESRRKQFQAVKQDLDMGLLRTNLRQQYLRIRDLETSGEGWWEERLFPRAAKAYLEGTKTIQQAREDLAHMRETAQAGREEAFRHLEEFQVGIGLFHPEAAEKLTRLKGEVERALADDHFARAIPRLQQIDELLPEGRFVPQDEGTLIDYVTGLMWGVSSEVAGSSMPWYKALTFADDLVFAERGDWRLPTREEVKTLAELPENDRQRLLPTVEKDTTVWTSENVREGGNTAYAVETVEFTAKAVEKSEKLLTVPVRRPE